MKLIPWYGAPKFVLSTKYVGWVQNVARMGCVTHIILVGKSKAKGSCG